MLHLFARRNLARQLPRHRADLPLQLPHSTLTSVARHHRHDRIVGERDLLVAQARFLELTRQQVFLRDLRLLFLGVAGEVHDFHAIEQRTGNVLYEVRGRDEQHFAQIERNTEVVIGEGVVLRRVEDLQQRARRITLE